MHPETSKPVWSRRAFLTRAGASGLAVAGWTALKTLPQAEAAEQKAKLVVTWSAYDTMDPHVKQDVSAAAFNLNLYDNLLATRAIRPKSCPGWRNPTRSATTARPGRSICGAGSNFTMAVHSPPRGRAL